MASTIPNFRGRCALVLHPADANRRILIEQLGRLGIRAEAIWPMPQTIEVKVDMIFFDADRGPVSVREQFWATQSVPIIAITGTEAPGRLEAMLVLEPSAMLNKPVRREAVFKALVFAAHNFSGNEARKEELEAQAEKIKARALVLKSVLLVMRRFEVDDDEAYAAIRRASMSMNLQTEVLAAMLLSSPDRYLKSIDLELRQSKLRKGRKAV